MKFSINQQELATALGIVSKGAATRSTLPILSGILLRAEDATLTLEATNLDLSIRYHAAAFVEEEGHAVIPSKLLVDVVRSLPNSAIHVEVSDDQATLVCETASFSLRTMMSEDFPGFPDIAPDASVAVPLDMFANMAKRVSRVVSRDESRPVLTGVLVQTEGDSFRMVATDSYRLAFTETKLADPGSEFEAVVAGAFLADLAALPASEATIEFGVSDNQIVARCGSTTLVNRRIEGNFPRYGQLLYDDGVTRATFDTKMLVDAVKRVSLLTDKTNPVKFDLNVASQTTQVSTSSQDVGAASETIASAIEGEDTVIGFNPAYVIDGLNSVFTPDITLELQSSTRPGILKTDTYYQPAEVGKERFAYVIMPVRLV